jgi:hypothetical protein
MQILIALRVLSVVVAFTCRSLGLGDIEQTPFFKLIMFLWYFEEFPSLTWNRISNIQ